MSRAKKSPDEDAYVLKGKVRDLEQEVSRLKSRLDDLRKAKNNTVFKREREVIQVGAPNLGKPVGVETAKYRELEQKFLESEARRKELEKKLKESEEKQNSLSKKCDEWKQQFENLERLSQEAKENFQLNIEKLKADVRENKARADDATSELERLRERLEIKAMQEENEKSSNNEREMYIANLINENTTLRMKVETLFNELSVKEARWLDSKENMTRKIQERWDQKYAKWMADTERKIEELRAANLVLKKCLAKRDGQEDTSATPGSSNSGAHPDE